MGEQLENLTQRLVQLPRFIRLLIAVFFSVMVTLAVSPLVDHIYLRFFFTVETVMIPALVTVTIGSTMYIWSWRIYIGVVNTIPPSEKRVLWYFGVGMTATIIVIVLLVQGVSILNLPD